MAYYSNFHHSNHPNMKQPYGGRPHRSPRSGEHGGSSYGGGSGDGGMGVGGWNQGGGGGGSYNGSQMMGGGGSRGGGGYQNGSGGSGSYQNGSGSNGNTLWMGNIDETMDEQFIQFAFNQVGVQVTNIKIIRNRDTGLPLGYGFVTFDDRATAQNALRDLNGKKLPNNDDEKARFFLKPANRQQGGGGGGSTGGSGGGQQRGLSIFVGNLSAEIDDDILMSAFGSYYPSVLSAKVITQDGQSKGFGFVTFEDEYDYQAALANPNMMLGNTPISISRARHSSQGQKRSYSGEGGGRSSSGGGNGGGGDMRSRRQY